MKQARYRLAHLGALAWGDPIHWANPGFWLVGICCRRMLTKYGTERQQAEFDADAYSADQSGSEISAAALIYFHVADRLPWGNLMNIVEKQIKTQNPDHDVFAEQVRMVRGTSSMDWMEALKRELKTKTLPYDTHPCLKARLKALGVSHKDALNLLLDHSAPRASDLIDDWPKIASDLGKKITARYRVYYFAIQEFKQFLTGKPME